MYFTFLLLRGILPFQQQATSPGDPENSNYIESQIVSFFRSILLALNSLVLQGMLDSHVSAMQHRQSEEALNYLYKVLVMT